jgi:tocopherol O-methyltransferase
MNTDLIRDHYDRISYLYRALWGEHIHHGYWEDNESSAEAQVKLIEQLASRAQIPRNARVLDVGCGVGGSSLWLAKNLDCSVLGITISPVQASMATEKARLEGLQDSVLFRVMDANQLDLPGESFDAIWVIECSEHLNNKGHFIENCYQLLKPGGVLALCAWLVAEELESDEQTRLVENVCRGMLLPSLASLKDYTDWMRASGFEHVETEEITKRVEETWSRCASLVERPEIKMILRVTDDRTRDFVEAFRAIRHAYSVGAMSYGMFTARNADGDCP